MRSLHADLTAAQQSDTRTPYIYLLFNQGGTNYTYTTTDSPNRVSFIHRWDEPYGGGATLRLRNHDDHFNTRDLRGFKLSIGWGYVGDTTQYSTEAPLYVLDQKEVSIEGDLYTELQCADLWSKVYATRLISAGVQLTGTLVDASNFTIGETITGSVSGATGELIGVHSDGITVINTSGTFQAAENADGATASCDSLTAVTAKTAAYGGFWDRDTTILAILQSVTSGALDDVVLDADDPDANVNTHQPLLAIETGGRARSVVRKLLQMTKCGGRIEADSKLHVLYLDTAAAAQYTFQLGGNHDFWINFRQQAIIMPNRVIFVDVFPDTENASNYIGIAQDDTSVNDIGTFTTIEVDPTIQSDAEALKRAEAWIAQRVAEAYQGYITAPMECGAELYDMIQAVDARSSLTTKGRIGRIDRTYDPANEVYEIRLTLGSLISSHGAMKISSDNLDTDLKDLTTATDKIPPKLPESINAWQIPAAIQGYQHDITFSATDDDTVAWGAGTIHFYDGSTQAILAGNTGNLADTGWRYVYFDLDDANPDVLKVATVATYLAGLTIKMGVVCLVRKSSAADIDASFIPSYGKEPLITADVIHLAGLTMDRLTDGSTYQRVLATSISAGNIKLTGNTVVDGEWYDESGVEIDAAHGINIYGTGNALTTRATKGGAIECYVGSDGKIYAGGGDVSLGSGGIIIIGTALALDYAAGQQRGIIYGDANGLVVEAHAGENLQLTIGTTKSGAGIHIAGGNIWLYNDILASPTKTLDLGSSSYMFNHFYLGGNIYICNDIYPNGDNSSSAAGFPSRYFGQVYTDILRYKNINTFQHHDDLGILRKLKTKRISHRKQSKLGRNKKGQENEEKIIGEDIEREVLDGDDFPDEVFDHEERFYDAGNVSGLIIGAIRQLDKEVEELKKRLKEQ